MSIKHLFLTIMIVSCSVAELELPQLTKDSVEIHGDTKKLSGSVIYFNMFEIPPLYKLHVTVKHLHRNFFGILQVHSHLYNVSFTDTASNVTIDGHNLGFNVFKDGKFIVDNQLILVGVKIVVAFIQYKKSMAPIPGDCSDVRRPMLTLIEHNKRLTVLTPGARMSSSICGNDSFEHRYLFRKVSDITAMGYFTGILEMLIAETARRYGYENTINFLYNETDYAKIKTSLLIVQTIALDKNGYAAYVPATTYSCNPILWGSDCHRINPNRFTYYLILFGVGLFIALRFLLPPLLLNAVIGAEIGIVTAILINLALNISNHALIIFYMVSALFGMILCMMTTRRLPFFRRWVVCFAVSYLSILSLFYLANASFNLMAFQYLFIFIFTTIFGLLLVFTPARESMICIVLGSLLIYFSLSYFTNGQLYGIIEHPIYLLQDCRNKFAVKSLLFTIPDVVCVFIVILFAMCIIILYDNYGEVWSRMLDAERRWMIEHLYLCSRAERVRFANENAPLITRYTETEEDDVFESPNTSKYCYQRTRRWLNY